MATVLKMTLPDDFDLKAVVPTYGFVKLSPNVWDHAHAVFQRPFAGVIWTVTQCGTQLRLSADRTVPRDLHGPTRRAFARMLRIDVPRERIAAFHRMYRPAKRRSYFRILRSPTLFEDMVKTLTTCNTAWSNTCTMNQRLCEHFGQRLMHTRTGESWHSFPTPAALARRQSRTLARKARLGYRAPWIVQLARQFAYENLEQRIEALREDPDALAAHLRSITGFGPYATANMLQLLDHYHALPVDTELIRHMREQFGITGAPRKVARKAAAHYALWHPYDFLVYWFELWTAHVVAPQNQNKT